MITDSSKFTRFEQPEEFSFLELSIVEIARMTILFAAGIFNPYGPTLNVIAIRGALVTDDELPIVHLMLNPFAQRAAIVGSVRIGKHWRPAEDFSAFFELDFGSCPTFLVPSNHLPEEEACSFFARYLTRFRDGQSTLNFVRRYPDDPFARASLDMREGMKDLMEPGLPEKVETEGFLSEENAEDLATILLEEKNHIEEIKAFFGAWEGSINFGRAAFNLALLSNQAMSFEKFMVFFVAMKRSCRLPDWH